MSNVEPKKDPTPFEKYKEAKAKERQEHLAAWRRLKQTYAEEGAKLTARHQTRVEAIDHDYLKATGEYAY